MQKFSECGKYVGDTLVNPANHDFESLTLYRINLDKEGNKRLRCLRTTYKEQSFEKFLKDYLDGFDAEIEESLVRLGIKFSPTP